MRITSIQLTNFLAHSTTKLTIADDSHLVLICGPNGAGKSAVAHGIRAALTGEPVRGLTKKNELSRLVKLGAAQGKVTVTTEAGGYELNLANGKHVSPTDKLSDSMAFVLEPARFFDASMDESKRRSTVRKAAGVRIVPSEVADDLIKAGHAPARVERIKSLLATGFDLPEKEAAKGATEARGVWKSITGEVYGDQKGGSWKSPVEGKADHGALDAAIGQVETLRRDQARAREELARLQGVEAAHNAAAARAEEAKGLDDEFQEMQRLDRLVFELARERDELVAVENAAGAEVTTYACPCCEASLVLRDGALAEASKVKTARKSPANAKRIAELNTLHGQQAALLAKSKAAVARLSALAEVKDDLPTRPTAQELQLGETVVSHLSEDIFKTEATVAVIREHHRAIEVARKDEKRVLEAHEDVQAFKALEEALHDAPAKYMAKALDPVRDAITYLATEAYGLDPDELTLSGDDMQMYYRGVPFPLASESEQWRMEVAIAYAIAVVSQVNFLLVDRLDVIQPDQRSPILDFFSNEKDVQTIMMGTLKADPAANLLDGGASIWLGA
jgi:hypothetical protein